MNLRLVVVCGLLALAGCASPPTHFYTLIAPEAAPAAVASDLQFQLQSVRIPVQVDQPSLVVRQDRGNLTILEDERWGAPLADEFHDALSARLEHEFGTRDLAGMPRQPGMPMLSVRTDVHRFESVPGQYALLDAVWSLTQNGEGGRSLTCGSTLRVPAAAGLSGVVLAHQQAIAQLAKAIADTGRAFARDPAQRCPG
jgi:hypothetical protein